MFEVGRLVARVALEGTQTLGRDLAASGQKFGAFAKTSSDSLARVGTATGLVGVGILALAGLAIKSFADFDKAMSSVQASTHATKSDMDDLRAAAVKAGADTAFSATEAAEGIDELSKAGVGVTDVLGGGLTGALSLAAAGELSVADAASVAATAMTQFKLHGDQIPHVADLLAAGAGKAQGSVSDLAAALNQGGLVASQAGFKIDETTGVLAAFASAGLLGSDAGTSLKTAILALQAPSSQASDLMRKYGIDVYDGSGKMLSFSAIAGQLQGKLGNLSDETRNATLATIFGTDAVRAAGVLYKEGADGIQDWNDKVNDSGYAAETARLKMDNLSGDIEYLKGSIDSALIQSGSAANDVLRNMVQTATGLVNAIGALPPPVLQAGLALTTMTGGTLGLIGVVLKVIPLVTTAQNVLKGLGISGKTAALGIGAAAGALTVVTLALNAYVQYQNDIQNTAKDFASTLDQTTGAITDQTRAMLVQKLAQDGVYGNAAAAKVGQKELTDAILEGGDALDKVNAKLAGKNNLVDFLNGGIQAGNAQQSITAITESLKGAKTQIEDQNKANEAAKASSTQLSGGLDDVAAAATDETSAIKTVTDALGAYASSALAARGGARAFEAAIDDATKAAKKNGQTLDIHTEKGRANQAALDGIAGAANKAASEQYALTGSVDSTRKVLDEGRSAFIKTAQKMGATKDEAKKLADQLLATPEKVGIQVKLTGGAAVIAQIGNIREHLGLVATAPKNSPTGKPGKTPKSKDADGSIRHYYAEGGFENHVAQISRVGTTRIWSEPETGGELYAPLAASKRSRSMDIIGQQLSEWGYDIVPKSGGGSRGSSSTKSGGNGPMRIRGELSVNGLPALIDARIDNALDEVATDTRGGSSV